MSEWGSRRHRSPWLEALMCTGASLMYTLMHSHVCSVQGNDKEQMEQELMEAKHGTAWHRML